MPAPKKGFTLIELLVVIAIIAILSVIGFTVFTNVQKGARDAKRRSDIDAIAKALEVHYKDGLCPPNNYCPPYPSYFSSGTVPRDPNNVTYIYSSPPYSINYNNSSPFDPNLGVDNGGILPGDSTIRNTTRSANNWKICADLEGDGVWDGTHQDFCRSNQQ